MSLLIVHVNIQVKSDSLEAFKKATIANVTESLKEPGIARFDFLQNNEDPTRFLLIEVYRHPEAPVAHKKTAHYAAWRDTVETMMASPRTSLKYCNLHPEDSGW